MLLKLSARSQTYLTTALLLFAIGFYISIYFKSISPGPLSSQNLIKGETSASQRSNLALVLNPDEHAFRDAKTIRHVWNITSGLRTPDGVTKTIYLINGHFPGPVIEARSGDEVVVEVNNGLDDEGTAIHWHGFSMRGANDMDGAVGVTQCETSPGQSFTYRFKIQDDESGTFWYHAHSDIQRADGLYGAFIIHPFKDIDSSEKSIHEYDEDSVLMVGDWYHRSAQEVQDYYTDWTNFGLEPAPDSMLLNGKGVYNCSMEIPARPIECKKVEMPPLRLSGGRTRLRIINTGALTGFTFSISGYAMTLLTVDGGSAVEAAPKAEALGVLYPGERMDVIVEQLESGKPTEPILTVTLDRENLKFKNFALTPTQHFSISLPASPKEASPANVIPQQTSFLNLANISGPTLPEVFMPTIADKTFLLYTKIEILSEFRNIPKGFINRTSWESRVDKLPLLALSRPDWGEAFVPWTGSEYVWVDIVLNNMDDKGHPFHLHGNNFYLLATHKALAGSYDAYNPFEDPTPPGGPLNTRNPVLKDTVYVPRMGYVVLRFRADNAGLWFFHCHILMHQKVGMAMVFQVGGSEMGVEGFEDTSRRLCGSERA